MTILEDVKLVGFKTRSTDSNWIARVEGPSGMSINVLGCKVRSVTAPASLSQMIDPSVSPRTPLSPAIAGRRERWRVWEPTTCRGASHNGPDRTHHHNGWLPMAPFRPPADRFPIGSHRFPEPVATSTGDERFRIGSRPLGPGTGTDRAWELCRSGTDFRGEKTTNRFPTTEPILLTACGDA